MRQIKAIPLNTQEWDVWREECRVATEELVTVVSNGGKPDVTSLYKKKYIRDHYFFSSSPPFYGKCVYCETAIRNIFPGDVEHFRPKGRITNEAHQPIYLKNKDGSFQLDQNGNKLAHPGYYWLAYDWKNLMPSCTYCNRPKEDFGKRNSFPVEGIHAQSPGEEIHERPLILNPISEYPEDNPENHFKLDCENGLLVPKTQRGQFCIDLFGLNTRTPLQDGRRSAAHSAKSLLVSLIFGPSANRESILEEMKTYSDGKKPFSFSFVLAMKEHKALINKIS